VAGVATGVTKGDLARSIQVEARGEVSELKDNINAMIGNLRGTTERNTEQDWLKTNLAKFSRMMQGQRDLVTVGKLLLSELAPLVNAQQGIVYVMDSANRAPCLKELASYADEPAGEREPRRYHLGEGLVGQAAADRQRLLLTDIPPDSIQLRGGLLSARPHHVIVLPVLYEGQVKAVLELASLGGFTASHLAFLEQLTGSIIGVVLNTIEATMRTEGLLTQSLRQHHRRGVEYHRGDDAHRGSAHAVPAARRRAAGAADRAAADQRRAGEQGEAARGAERGGRAQEPGNRARPAGARGEGGGARAHLALQVGVPGEHVARAAHTAQQHPD